MPDELADDERVIAAATPEPWTVGDAEVYLTISSPGQGLLAKVYARSTGNPGDRVKYPGQKRANAAFIARARSRWPALVKEVRELQAEIDRFKEELRDVRAEKNSILATLEKLSYG